MHRLRLIVPLVLLAAAIVPSSSSARCALVRQDLVLIPANATVSSGGSFVVGLVRSFGRGQLTEIPSDLALVRGAERVPLRVENLAPGLARATPERALSGTWQLSSDTDVNVSFARMQLPSAPSALRVSGLEHRATSPGSRRSAAQYDMALTLAAPLERGIVALAAVSGTSGSWVPIESGVTTYDLFPTMGRCEQRPSGFTALPPGSRARIIAVDAHGRSAEASIQVR